MTAIVLQTGVLAPTAIAPSASGAVLAGVSLGRYDAGYRIVLRQRFVEFRNDVVSAPAGTPSEGPYLRITPETGIVGGIPDRLGVSTKQMKTRNYNGETIGGAVTPTQSYGQFYYEVNANAASVYLPFNATLELVTTRAGSWVYDLLTFEDENASQEQQSRLRLTRNIYGAITRILTVPVGAYAVEFTGTGFAASTFELHIEEVGKNVNGSNTSYLLGTPVQGAAGIVTLGNARYVNIIQVGALPASIQAHFHIAIP